VPFSLPFSLPFVVDLCLEKVRGLFSANPPVNPLPKSDKPPVDIKNIEVPKTPDVHEETIVKKIDIQNENKLVRIKKHEQKTEKVIEGIEKFLNLVN